MSNNLILESTMTLPVHAKNLASMLSENSKAFSGKTICQEIKNDVYEPLLWEKCYQDIIAIQQYLLSIGFSAGDRLAILSTNCSKMLEIELAVMSMGGIAVPIFPGYSQEKTNLLVDFCEANIVALEDDTQINKLSDPDKFRKIIYFNDLNTSAENQISFSEIIGNESTADITGIDIPSDTVCLMMYTSGTMGKPKCVQLTHGNILSQQAAMRALWELKSTDRFLSYLPWHHSFGGIFEKYAAICNGAVLSLDNSSGKDIDRLLANWRKVKPTVFFSVPRIYQSLATMMRHDPEIEDLIFHDELRFIFTAAAPLPKNISDIFEKKNIPVYEGWGLTETSPCCTVTDSNVPRKIGVVGKPIAGVSLKLSHDGEILVKGPNVMTGYYHNPDETEKVLLEDGWFKTGDVGTFTDTGLKLISRKDRIFKLSNAKKVIPAEIENLIAKDCAYLSHAYVSGSGKDYPVVLLFPNTSMFDQKPDESQIKEDCLCPKNLVEYVNCLTNCLENWNHSIDAKYSRINRAKLIDYELTIENEELTPSMKLAPNVVGKIFKAEIEALYSLDTATEDVYVIKLG
jgi:long-subunit acyl-CoA synthetase (AMP-forming)